MFLLKTFNSNSDAYFTHCDVQYKNKIYSYTLLSPHFFVLFFLKIKFLHSFLKANVILQFAVSVCVF